ncbi:DNA-binding transcriptional regulator, AcrR family [Syntrophus gentianae]|uniref:DNA-binding transcriptional regulator, AcrR family n=1 Tax=Syntrophus gentianae TaxID=43775 RepID=A0A1H7VLT6_9BACT|nr:TetR/AcrR family transcriptional regulator [Syntrophus gentianae]SEM10206.1 DNA-binding transcriptional regulator, AcrR family [Syntrophus gentianae]
MIAPDKRNEIIQAALELIAEKGFHGAPMAMIAEKSDVAVGTIYRYFENKDVLINALYKEVEAKILVALREGYSAEKPFRERFIHLGTALLRYFISFPLHFRFMEQYHNSPYGVSLQRDRVMGKAGEPDIFTELFSLGLAQQVLKDFPLPVLFDLAFGPLIALARDHILGFVILDEFLLIRTVEACWDGIKR